MDSKGIALYLILSALLIVGLTFVLAAEGVLTLLAPSVSQYFLLMVLMGIPGLAALVAKMLIRTPAPSAPLQFRPGTWGNGLRVLIMPPVLFAVAYSVAAFFGMTNAQWNLAGLLNEVERISGAPLEPTLRQTAPWVILATYPFVSVALALQFGLVAVCAEIGWRWYLLPRLMPLGALPAYLLTGLCWGLWFLPLIYLWHRETGDFNGIGGVIFRFIALGIALSMVLGPMMNRTGNIGLSALALGGLAGQACGLWEHLFQQTTPPWTGALGWIMIAVLLVSAGLPGIWSTSAVTSHGADEEDSTATV